MSKAKRALKPIECLSDRQVRRRVSAAVEKELQDLYGASTSVLAGDDELISSSAVASTVGPNSDALFIDSHVEPLQASHDDSSSRDLQKHDEIRKLVRKKALDTSWPSYPARILGRAETYEEACRKLQRAEDTSDLNTEVDQNHIKSKRRRRPAQKTLSDEECPPPAAKKLAQIPAVSTDSLPPSAGPSRPTPTASSGMAEGYIGFQGRILAKLEVISNTLAAHTRELKEIRRIITQHPEEESENLEEEDHVQMPSLPATSLEELHVLDNLCAVEANRKALRLPGTSSLRQGSIT
ncbi:unnamed protein product [Darwinula stevensoni]|uniref:Uncharacterized protein n=1 Tax=Darwinula stevensoni TaxID=69355 RepID=A0A7R9A2E2_9CRUS|nr:unnamed protein product [Darwinula stevensoni]CAG0889506.1 unnamed protein product [Darwinula stevensoni]